jgi:hypothetical protein
MRAQARRRFQEPGDHAHGGRFSGAVGTEKAQHLAAVDAQRQAVDGGEAAEAFRQILRLDQSGHRTRSVGEAGTASVR